MKSNRGYWTKAVGRAFYFQVTFNVNLAPVSEKAHHPCIRAIYEDTFM
jgi:hypothetical protein